MNTTILSIIALSLTIAALSLSIWQLFKARAQTVKLDNISESLSTRFIGPFPDYINEINRILANARSKVSIACDVPSFVAFSDPDAWFTYQKNIEKKIRAGINMEITFLDKDLRKKTYRDQFKQARLFFSKWVQSDNIQDRMRAYIRCHPTAKEEPQCYEDFERSLEENDDDLILRFFSHTSLVETGIPLFNYFWIVDNIQAVFAIPTAVEPKGGFVTHGFYTEDPRLIAALRSVGVKYRGSKA
ncbi:MAG: hypothetical protein PVH61_12850 [Candidatus Aminicenantes bacterium]|jgi:hypothetical protein